MSPEAQKHPFQFNLRTALFLMLVLGAGSGLWIRRQHRFARFKQQRIEAMADLKKIMDQQVAVTGKILGRFNADKELPGAMKYQSGPGNPFDGSANWIVELRFSSGPIDDPTSTNAVARFLVAATHRVEKLGTILIATKCDPKYEDRVDQIVAELEGEYKAKGWASQRGKLPD